MLKIEKIQHTRKMTRIEEKDEAEHKKVFHLEAKIIKTFPISIEWIIRKLELVKFML
jgi:hypothetical protein